MSYARMPKTTENHTIPVSNIYLSLYEFSVYIKIKYTLPAKHYCQNFGRQGGTINFFLVTTFCSFKVGISSIQNNYSSHKPSWIGGCNHVAGLVCQVAS